MVDKYLPHSSSVQNMAYSGYLFLLQRSEKS